MATNYRFIYCTIVIFIGIATINATCNKSGLDCTQVKYRFDLPAKVTPDNDYLSTGDSLVLEINESINFVDLNTSQNINFNNAGNLGSAIGFQRFDSLAQFWFDAVQSFNFKLIEGKATSSVNELLFKEFLFPEKNSRYLFKLILIPKEKGLYRFVFSNSSNTYRKNEPCIKANFNIILKETSHNRYLVGHADEDIPGGDFYFVVK
ncbi:hypothetical protein GCM10027036_03310 [Flavihumibacter cheonanensis]|uniref:hypothetical protein n=1 Tax=Flavihumibacter TaxID=1004301 RepID=UPI001EF7EA37|nr:MULTISPECIES: hypothetical protein [Flavihumibacter]MCG7752225.1 hypothetical protein [Flavihumibacter cheonanensis]